ncbi:MAG: DUF4339 domain-containing protein [Prevotella sp.]|nr:DUF4339 domain-containing protein [Prevotella sp.]
MEYFIYVNGQNQGPYSVQTLMSMGITPDTLVWSRELNQWTKAGTIPELQAAFNEYQQGMGPQQNGPQQNGQQQMGQPQYEDPGQQGYQPYQPMGGGAGFKEFFTDEYESEDDVPFVKRPLNSLMKLIDTGRFFREPMRWIYIVIGILATIGCLISIISLIGSGAFKYQTFYSILASLALIVIGVFVFLFWINRSKRLKDTVQVNDEIVAIPLVAHFIQSLGECVGIIFGTVLAVMAFLLPLLAGGSAAHMFREIIPFSAGSPLIISVLGAIFCVIYGFLIILVAHFWAEMMLAVASIANNVKRIAQKTNEEPSE